MNIFLKNKNYRQFSIASFLSSAGDILFYLALMTYASKLQNYSLALSLIAISEAIPRFFDIFGGYLADRTHHKFKNIFLMCMLRFILYLVVGLLFASHLNDWILVLAVILINLISDTFGSYSSGLISPLVADIVGKEDFGIAEGFTSGVAEVINTVAQFAGAGLLLFMSYSSLAYFNALTFLIAGFFYLRVGYIHQKKGKSLEHQEINKKNFWETMKTSYKQVRKQYSLLSVVLIIAILNGILDAMEALIPIVMVGHRSTMIISTYSFTIAIIGVIISVGAALGSMFGPQLFKKVSIFTVIILALIFGFGVTSGALIANLYVILPFYFLLAVTASLGSIKLTQWLVTTVDHKILASSVGLLNTILMITAPIMTTFFTSISGFSNIKYALLILLIIEILVLIITVKICIQSKRKLQTTKRVMSTRTE